VVFQVGQGVVEIETKQTRVLTNYGCGDDVEDVEVGLLGDAICDPAQGDAG
jgi:hypothetical protein